MIRPSEEFMGNWFEDKIIAFVSTQSPNVRAKAGIKTVLWGALCAGAFISVSYLVRKPDTPSIVIDLLEFKPTAYIAYGLPAIFFMAAFLELLSGKSFQDIITSWQTLSGWEQAGIYIGVCSLAIVLVFFGFYIMSR